MTQPRPHPRALIAWSAIISVLASSLISVTAGPARADYDVRKQRLVGLQAQELALLAPFTAAGPVALIEFADTKGDELPAVNVVTRIAASPDQVLQVIRHPEHYPQFMGMLDEITVVQKARSPSIPGAAVVYDWAWDLSLFRLSGRNIMRVYEAPPSRPGRGHRVTIDSQRGDFGAGRMVFRLLPHNDSSTLMVLSVRLDLREANYIARKAAGAARSVNRSANMALGYAMALGIARKTKRDLKRTSHLALTPHPTTSIPELGPQLWPLTTRGDLVFQTTQNGKLESTRVLGRLGHGQAQVRKTLLNIQEFGAALAPGSEAHVVEEHNEWALFDWDLNIPLLGVSGRMRMDRGNPTIKIAAVDGALKGGRWQVEAVALPSPATRSQTLVSSRATFDIRRTNFVVRALVDADAYLGQGITAASQVMLLRALRSRVRKAVQRAPPRRHATLKKQ